MRILTLLLLFVSVISFAKSAEDSVRTLAFDDFYQLVIQNHPIVKKASLLTQQAAQEIRLARGSFDPKLEGSWDLKDFKDSEYYNLLDVSIKIPVWFPIDPKVGMQQNSGDYLNPENYISNNNDNQQIYAGASLPIGKGLFIDDRRATVRQAQFMQNLAEAEQVKAINKILLTAVKDYWEWYFAFNNYTLMQQSIGLATDIFERTKVAFSQGEAARIDTIQAKITLLARITAFQQANIERVTAALKLSNHLWTADGAPLELENNVRPVIEASQEFSANQLMLLLDMARVNHPELRKLELKNKILLIDRSLARENLKPRLDLNYFLLDQPIDTFGSRNNLTPGNNYKIGVDFAFPIFLRKERAKLSMTKLKLTENSYNIDFTERQILNDINAQYNEIVTTKQILVQQQEMAANYQLILQAEQLNLDNGESDLFKINIQIDKLIEAKSKALKLQSTYQKNVATLYWAAGISNLGY
jgi:outer membrane protein TolC